MTGEWRASSRRNRRTGLHTVHYQVSPGKNLCGRLSEKTIPADVNGPWDHEDPNTCQICRSWYLLFYEKEKESVKT